MNLRSSLLLASLLNLAACGDSPQAQLEAAKGQMARADYRAAIINVKNVLQKDPVNLTARMMLGRGYLEVDAYEDAVKELQRAREQGAKPEEYLPLLLQAQVHAGQDQAVLEQPDPISPPALAATVFGYKSMVLLGKGRRDEAEQLARQGLQADPQSAAALMAQALIHVQDQQLEQALAAVDAALKQEPGRMDARYQRASLLRQLGRQADAVAALEGILKLNPLQFRAHLELAQIAIAADNLEAADKAVSEAERIAPKSVLTQYNRGLLELRRNNARKAEEVLTQVVSLAPEYVPALVAQAMAFMSLNQPESALRAARSVLALAPGHDPATRIMAAAQSQLGDDQGAIHTLSPLRDANPDDASLSILLNSVRYKQHQSALNAVMEKMKARQFEPALQAVATLAQALPNDALPHNLRGAILLAKQDKVGARAAFERALTVQPDAYAAVYYLGRMDLADNRPEAARKRLEQFLERDKRHSQAMVALAELAALQNQEQAAVEWLRRALRSAPRSHQARARLVSYHLARKETKEALELAREGVQLHDSSEANGLLGETLMAAGDLPGAIVRFRRAAERDKTSPQALIRLAQAQLAHKDVAAARASLEYAVKARPGYLPAQQARIGLEVADRKFDDALRLARELQTADVKSPLGHEREGDVHMARHLYPDAARAYEAGLARQASTPLFIKLHRALSRSGRVEEAEKRLGAWLQARPDDLMFRAYAAEHYTGQGKRREAIAQYEVILARTPASPAELNNLALLYQQERNPKALALAEKALKLAPQVPQIQDTVGWILLESGQIKRGLSLIQTAHAANPKDASTHYHLAAALARSGDKPAARTELERLLASPSNFPELEAAKALLLTL